MPPLPLSQFETLAKLVLERHQALECLERYRRATAFSAFYPSDGTTASDAIPDALITPFRDLLVQHGQAELAAVDASLLALGVDVEG